MTEKRQPSQGHIIRILDQNLVYNANGPLRDLKSSPVLIVGFEI
jgi:hypothetical protein